MLRKVDVIIKLLLLLNLTDEEKADFCSVVNNNKPRRTGTFVVIVKYFLQYHFY